MTSSTPSATTTTDAVVVGIDGSESAKTALQWALFMAATLQCSVLAVAAWQPTAGWGGLGWTALPSDWSPADDTARMLHDTIKEVQQGQASEPVTTLVQEGSAAQVLLAASSAARLLVVGSRGHGGFAGLLLGSVSTACAEHATCPVLVVHGSTPPPVLAAPPARLVAVSNDPRPAQQSAGV